MLSVHAGFEENVRANNAAKCASEQEFIDIAVIRHEINKEILATLVQKSCQAE